MNEPLANRSTTISHVEVDRYADRFNLLLNNIEIVMKGKQDQVAMALVCVLAEGHLLLEDVPGTGKTVLAKSIANSIDGTWNRIQFTPDLLPSDVTGGLVYSQTDGTFELHRGPVFANVILADEVNRASPKTQAALLEVMEEQQVTIGNNTNAVPRPFVVIATQNPVEQAGTYRLPEAQLDRFLMRTSLGYPSEDAEVAVLADEAMKPEQLGSVLTTAEVGEMVSTASQIHVEPTLQRYIVRLAAATRELPELRLGASTRGSLALLRCARSLAASQGREYAMTDDVKTVAPLVLGHRLLLTPDAELRGISTSDLIESVLDSVAPPTAAIAA